MIFWIAQCLILLGVLIASPLWLLVLWKTPKMRAGFFEKWGLWSAARVQRWQAWMQLRKLNATPTIWVHAVSVGEFLAVKPLIQQLLDRSVSVVVSTTTLTGQQLAQEAFGQRALVCYFPFDWVVAIDVFLKRLKPDAVILTETELWPTFIHRASQYFQCPVFLINGRISDRSFPRYLLIKNWIIKPLLLKMTGLLMQSDQDAQRVIVLGAKPETVEVWGNLKLDLPQFHTGSSLSEASCSLKTAWFFGDSAVPILTFASTHVGEERLFLEQVCKPLWVVYPQLKVVLAPRHPERTAEVQALLKAFGISYQKRSNLSKNGVVLSDCKLLLLDTVGELKTVFGLSTVAVVAGSFLPKLGGHNILEPIAMQCPTVFGAFMSNFSEIARLVLVAEAGIQVHDMVVLTDTLLQLLDSPSQRKALVAAGNRFLALNQGNTTRLAETLLARIPIL